MSTLSPSPSLFVYVPVCARACVCARVCVCLCVCMCTCWGMDKYIFNVFKVKEGMCLFFVLLLFNLLHFQLLKDILNIYQQFPMTYGKRKEGERRERENIVLCVAQRSRINGKFWHHKYVGERLSHFSIEHRHLGTSL